MKYESVDEVRGGGGENGSSGWAGGGRNGEKRQGTDASSHESGKTSDRREVTFGCQVGTHFRMAELTECRSRVSVRVQFYMWGKLNKHQRSLQRKKKKTTTPK